MMLLATWSQVTGPVLVGQAVDCYLTPGALVSAGPSAGGLSGPSPAAKAASCWYDPPSPNWTTADYLAGLGGLVLRLGGLYLLGAAATGLMFYLMTWSAQHVLRTLRTQVFDQIHRLSIGYHVEHETGDTMSRVTNDADTIQQGDQLRHGSGAERVGPDRLGGLQHAAQQSAVCADRPLQLAAHGDRHLLVLGPGPAGFPAHAPRDGFGQRRTSGKHLRRARSRRPSTGKTRTSPPSARRMPPTATPTSGPWPSPPPWRRPSRPWATSP